MSERLRYIRVDITIESNKETYLVALEQADDETLDELVENARKRAARIIERFD